MKLDFVYSLELLRSKHKEVKNVMLLTRLQFLPVLLSLLFLFVSISLVYADNPATITASVQPKLISVTVSNTSVNYGQVALSQPAESSVIIVSNNGNVQEDLTITGSSASTGPGGSTWTLGSTIGSNQYTHEFAVSPNPGSPTTYNFMTTSSSTLANDVPASSDDSDRNLKLKITLPTSTSTYSTFTTNVIISASEG